MLLYVFFLLKKTPCTETLVRVLMGKSKNLFPPEHTHKHAGTSIHIINKKIDYHLLLIADLLSNTKALHQSAPLPLLCWQKYNLFFLSCEKWKAPWCKTGGQYRPHFFFLLLLPCNWRIEISDKVLVYLICNKGPLLNTMIMILSEWMKCHFLQPNIFPSHPTTTGYLCN